MKTPSESHFPPLNRRILYGITNWALLGAGLANLGVGTWSAFNQFAAIAATSLTAGLVLLFAATIDRFESLKGLGIEAKTIQLDQKIVQADGALLRLREMTEITATALLNMHSKMGRFDSAPGVRESIALANQVRQIMKNLGSEESAIATALHSWARMLCLDMARALTNGLYKKLQSCQQVLEFERLKIQQPIQSNDPNFLLLNAKIKSIDDFQKFRLQKLHLLVLEDYPDKFMELFKNVPEIDTVELESLRLNAARFEAGMRSLRQTQTLSDSELWIDTLNLSRD
jgi:hypothetical protein